MSTHKISEWWAKPGSLDWETQWPCSDTNPRPPLVGLHFGSCTNNETVHGLWAWKLPLCICMNGFQVNFPRGFFNLTLTAVLFAMFEKFMVVAIIRCYVVLHNHVFKPLLSKKKLLEKSKGLTVKRFLHILFVLLYRSCRSYGSDSESDRSYSRHRSPSESSRDSWKPSIFLNTNYIFICKYLVT